MGKPLLQIALDNLTVQDAIQSAKKAAKYIDVIEVGTILISSEGKNTIKKIKENFKNKIIVADGKIADAGSIFAKMFFDNGADFTTCICAAETPTIKSVLDVGKKYGKNKDVQIELTSHFTWQQVQEWKDIGIKQLVYHRSRDSQLAGKSWSNQDIENIKKLSDMGFKMTVTGGIIVEDLKLFKGIPVYIFIAGRAIRDSQDPEQSAKLFQEELKRLW